MWKINEVRSKNVLEKRKSYIISCGKKKSIKINDIHKQEKKDDTKYYDMFDA